MATHVQVPRKLPLTFWPWKLSTISCWGSHIACLKTCFYAAQQSIKSAFVFSSNLYCNTVPLKWLKLYFRMWIVCFIYMRWGKTNRKVFRAKLCKCWSFRFLWRQTKKTEFYSSWGRWTCVIRARIWYAEFMSLLIYPLMWWVRQEDMRARWIRRSPFG